MGPSSLPTPMVLLSLLMSQLLLLPVLITLLPRDKLMPLLPQLLLRLLPQLPRLLTQLLQLLPQLLRLPMLLLQLLLLPQLPQLLPQLPPMGMLVPSTLAPSLLLTQMELLSQLMCQLLPLPGLTTLPPREFMEESMPMLDQLFMLPDMPVSSPSPMELLSQSMSQPLLLLTKREPISHYDCL